jgi:hypothetical protein
LDLNRHLVAISPGAQSPQQPTCSRSLVSWNLASLVPSFVQQGFKSITSMDAPLKLGLMLFALTGLITAAYLGATMPQLKSNSAVPAVAQPQLTGSLAHTPISAASTTTPQAITSTTSTPSVKDKIDDFFAKQRHTAQLEKERALEDLRKMAEKEEHLKAAARLREKLEKKKTEMRRREEIARTAKIGGFEIQTSGSQQFILRPSKGFAGRTRKPQLQIQVSRDSKNVPIRYERTMDGVYVVDLEDQYPTGSFNVSIATHSKPLMQQSFNIKLGHNKSRVEQWWSSLQRESATAQHVLHDVSSSILQQLQTMPARIAGTTHIWKDKVERSERDVADRVREAQDRVREAQQQIDRRLQEVRDEVWTSLRQTTAPVRTSRRTLWARNNAYVWRCGFERAVGLSSRDKDGKKTRSCQSANW